MDAIDTLFGEIDKQNAPLGAPTFEPAPGASKPDAIDSMFAEIDRQRGARRQGAITTGLQQNPEQAGRRNALARDAGMPASALEDQKLMEEAARRVRAERLAQDAQDAPTLGRKLQEPAFVAVAQDDDKLGLIERAVRALKRGWHQSQAGMDVATASAGAESLRALDANTTDTPGGAALLAPTAKQRGDARLREAMRTTEAITSFDANAKRVRELGPGEAYKGFGQSESWPETLSRFVQNPGKILAEVMGESLGGQAVMLPAIAAGGLAAGPAGLALATGLSSSSAEMMGALSEILAEKKIDPADQQAVLAAVASPEFQAEMARKVRKAINVGAFDALGARLAGVKIAPKAATPAMANLSNILAQTGIQMTTGGAGEAAGSLAAGEKISPAGVFAEMIAELPGGISDVSILAARNVIVPAAKAEAATRNAETLVALDDLRKQSTLAARDPHTFQQFVDEAAKDGDVTDVYVDANRFADALNQSGVDPVALERAVPGLAQRVAEARDAGGDVRISVGEFSAHLAQTPVAAAVMDQLRTEIDGPTIAEAREFMQGAQERFTAEAERVLAAKDTADAAAKSADTVRGQIEAQLKAANRFTGPVNGAYASMMGNFYAAMGARLGLSAEQMFAKYPVQIDRNALGGAGVEQGAVAGQVEAPKPENSPAEEGAAAPAVASGGAPQSATEQASAQNGAILTQGPRGRLALPGQDITQAPPIIQLLEGADLSTFIHESGHFYLEVLTHIAAQPDAPAALAQDMAAILKWFGVPDLATWQGMTLDQKRPYHEQFARGFEAYTFEGKAPSHALSEIFARFRAWMMAVYRSLSALDVTLTDEVRGVFDRMLATDHAIAETEKTAGFAPVFDSAQAAGMTADEWTEYQRQIGAATADAVIEMQTRSLRDMQRTSNAIERAAKEITRQAAAIRKGIHAEVQAEVRARPEYRALRFIKRGEMNGQKLEAGLPHRLDPDAMAIMYGGEFELIMERLGKGFTSEKNGIHPDKMAELLGFTSGDHLIRTLLDAVPEGEVITARTDQRMLEEHGEIATPEDIQRVAQAAVHNEARGRAVATEMRALAKMAGNRELQNLSRQAARESAAAVVARAAIRDLSPAGFAANASRAAKRAEQAIGKNRPVEAATEKRNQLLNHYAARAAHDARDEVRVGTAYLRKFERDAIRKAIPPEYMEQIDALLERFELRPVSERDLAKRKSLVEWVENQRAAGFEPAIDETLLNRPTTGIRALTVEQFRGLVDTVKNIEHLGRLKTTLLANKHKREFQAAVAAAVAAIDGNAKRTIPERLEAGGVIERIKSGAREFFALHRKWANLWREMDGWKDNGDLWNLFVRPMNDAADKEATARAKATGELTQIMAPLLKKNMRQKVYIAEIKDSLSYEGRLAVALNWGNDTNRQRVMGGDRWNATQVAAILRTLTREDYEVVQKVWDYIDTFWPDIRAKELRVTGLAPEKVAASPVTVESADGPVDLRGGYYPIKYDTQRSTRSEADDMAEMVRQSMQGLYTRATTRRGHTKQRVEEVNRPVSKSLGTLFGHVEQVIHDLSWHETLIDTNRLVKHSEIDAAIREHYGPEVLKQLRNMLDDVAVGEAPARNVFERSINHVRVGATIAGLAWNVTTAALQPFGLTQSMVRIGPKWVAKGLAGWLTSARGAENSAAWIYERSEMMRLRGLTMQREINEIRNRVTSGKSTTRTAVEESYFWMIQTMQKVADIPTWIGAYEKAIDAGQPDDKAVALADQAVLDAQGGGQIKDLAGIQRGGPLMKLWTNFYSFFSTTYNLLSESAGRTNFRDPLSVMKLANDYILLMIVPSLMATLLKAAIKGDVSDEDELLKKIAQDQAGYLLGTMVGLRDVGSFVSSDFGWQGPAGIRFVAEANKLGKQVMQGEVDEAALKAANNTAGVLFHYPAGAVQRAVTGFSALAEGRTANPFVILTGPPKD